MPGYLLDGIEISHIALPLVLPVVLSPGADMASIAIPVAMPLQTSVLTPPFGWALFFLKADAPPSVTTADIQRGVLPFIALHPVALTLVFLVPGLATWRPDTIGW